MIRGCRQGREGAVSFPSDRELFRWISALEADDGSGMGLNGCAGLGRSSQRNRGME